MADIKWIKITTDIFDDEKIKLIEKLPEGDTILIIWLKLLTMAGKRNDSGMIYITRDIPYTPDTLSDIMNRDNKIIMLALNTFVSFEMIEIVDDIIQIINWDKHQNVEGLEKIKEQNRERQRRFREKNQVKQIENKSNVISRYNNAIDKNRKDKEKNINKTEKYETIYKHWNSKKNTRTHKIELFNKHVKKQHVDIMEIYGEGIIIQSIDNYDKIIGSEDYYFNYKWSFWEFLTRGIDNFTNDAEPYRNYKSNRQKIDNTVNTTPNYSFEVE